MSDIGEDLFTTESNLIEKSKNQNEIINSKINKTNQTFNSLNNALLKESRILQVESKYKGLEDMSAFERIMKINEQNKQIKDMLTGMKSTYEDKFNKHKNIFLNQINQKEIGNSIIDEIGLDKENHQLSKKRNSKNMMIINQSIIINNNENKIFHNSQEKQKSNNLLKIPGNSMCASSNHRQLSSIHKSQVDIPKINTSNIGELYKNNSDINVENPRKYFPKRKSFSYHVKDFFQNSNLNQLSNLHAPVNKKSKFIKNYNHKNLHWDYSKDTKIKFSPRRNNPNDNSNISNKLDTWAYSNGNESAFSHNDETNDINFLCKKPNTKTSCKIIETIKDRKEEDNTNFKPRNNFKMSTQDVNNKADKVKYLTILQKKLIKNDLKRDNINKDWRRMSINSFNYGETKILENQRDKFDLNVNTPTDKMTKHLVFVENNNSMQQKKKNQTTLTLAFPKIDKKGESSNKVSEIKNHLAKFIKLDNTKSCNLIQKVSRISAKNNIHVDLTATQIPKFYSKYQANRIFTSEVLPGDVSICDYNRSDNINNNSYEVGKNTNPNTSLLGKYEEVLDEKEKKKNQILSEDYLLIEKYTNGIKHKETNVLDLRNFLRMKRAYDSLSEDEDCKIWDKNKYFLHPQSSVRLILDFFVFFICLYSITLSPISLIYNDDFSIFYSVLQMFIDAILILDLLLSFITAYYDFEENLVFSLDKMVSNYLTGFFFCDFLSAVPFNSLQDWEKFRYYKYNKRNIINFDVVRVDKDMLVHFNFNNLFLNNFGDIKRILKLFRLFKSFKGFYKNEFLKKASDCLFMNSLNSSSNQKLLAYYLYFFIISHILSCIFIFLGSVDYPNWIISAGLQDKSILGLYINSLYFNHTTIFTVGYGDILTKNIYERTYNSILMMVGIMFYSFALTSISNIIKTNTEKHKEYEQKKNFLNNLSETYFINSKLYEKLTRHLFHEMKQEKNKILDFLDGLPISIRNETILNMHRKIILSFNFFKDCFDNDFIIFVIMCLKPTKSIRKEILIKQEDFIEEIIFIKSGLLQVEISTADLVEKNKFLSFKYTTLQNDESKKPMYHETLKILEIQKNEHFGDAIMIENQRSPITVRTRSKVAELYLMSKINLVKISEVFPTIFDKIIEKSFFNYQQILEKIVIKKQKFIEKELKTMRNNRALVSSNPSAVFSIKNKNNVTTNNNFKYNKSNGNKLYSFKKIETLKFLNLAKRSSECSQDAFPIDSIYEKSPQITNKPLTIKTEFQRKNPFSLIIPNKDACKQNKNNDIINFNSSLNSIHDKDAEDKNNLDYNDRYNLNFSTMNFENNDNTNINTNENNKSLNNSSFKTDMKIPEENCSKDLQKIRYKEIKNLLPHTYPSSIINKNNLFFAEGKCNDLVNSKPKINMLYVPIQKNRENKFEKMQTTSKFTDLYYDNSLNNNFQRIIFSKNKNNNLNNTKTNNQAKPIDDKPVQENNEFKNYYNPNNYNDYIFNKFNYNIEENKKNTYWLDHNNNSSFNLNALRREDYKFSKVEYKIETAVEVNYYSSYNNRSNENANSAIIKTQFEISNNISITFTGKSKKKIRLSVKNLKTRFSLKALDKKFLKKLFPELKKNSLYNLKFNEVSNQKEHPQTILNTDFKSPKKLKTTISIGNDRENIENIMMKKLSIGSPLNLLQSNFLHRQKNDKEKYKDNNFQNPQTHKKGLKENTKVKTQISKRSHFFAKDSLMDTSKIISNLTKKMKLSDRRLTRIKCFKADNYFESFSSAERRSITLDSDCKKQECRVCPDFADLNDSLLSDELKIKTLHDNNSIKMNSCGKYGNRNLSNNSKANSKNNKKSLKSINRVYINRSSKIANYSQNNKNKFIWKVSENTDNKLSDNNSNKTQKNCYFINKNHNGLNLDETYLMSKLENIISMINI